MYLRSFVASTCSESRHLVAGQQNQRFPVSLQCNANAPPSSASQVTWDAREITLHAGNVLGGFQYPTVEEVGVGLKAIRSIQHDVVGELFHIRLDEPSLELGHKYRITINYSGSLSADQRGFFRAAVNDGLKARYTQ